MNNEYSDIWETPQDLFDELDREFHFDLDPCALLENAKCLAYYTPEQDGLKKPWFGNVFMNPPYGRHGNQILRWVQKAKQESERGCTVVALLPNSTCTTWFHLFCVNCSIRFIKGRLKFRRFDGKIGRARQGHIIVIFKPKN